MSTLIKRVNVFDGKNSQIRENRNIVIENHLVTDIVTGDVSEERFDQIIDGNGFYAIPGLTDAHVHFGWSVGQGGLPGASLEYDIVLSTIIARKLIDLGVTTVRDAGGITVGLKKAIDEGRIVGPRIFPSNAYISQTCGHGDSDYAHLFRADQYRFPTYVALADGPDEVKRAVREQLYRGASQIKVMAGGGASDAHDPTQTLQYSFEELKSAVEAAADYGTYVMVHLYTPNCIQRAVRAGVKSLEHAHVLDEETAKMIADAGAFVDPMPQFTKQEMEWNHMSMPKNINPEKAKALMEWKDRQIALTTELLIKHDIKILFGTDLAVWYPDYEPRENFDFMEYKKRFGSYKGLLAATGNFNDIVKLTTYQNPYPEGELGVLKKGSYADLLLLSGNPVEDLDVLGEPDNIRLVMKDGNVYKNTLENVH